MLQKIYVALSLRGWRRTSGVLLELDCWLAGIGPASRRIREERERRRQQPHAFVLLDFPEA